MQIPTDKFHQCGWIALSMSCVNTHHSSTCLHQVISDIQISSHQWHSGWYNQTSEPCLQLLNYPSWRLCLCQGILIQVSTNKLQHSSADLKQHQTNSNSNVINNFSSIIATSSYQNHCQQELDKELRQQHFTAIQQNQWHYHQQKF